MMGRILCWFGRHDLWWCSGRRGCSLLCARLRCDYCAEEHMSDSK